MKFTFDEIVKATDAKILHCQNNKGRYSVSTDSRSAHFENIYLPLKGEKFDGHSFIQNAIQNGVKAYFTSDKTLVFSDIDCVLYVEDTLEAYLKLASFYKSKVNPKTIAITGSSGKTTTKEMMASVANKGFRMHKSILNHNNEVGLCQTMLAMPENTEVLVVEMGMRGQGEIELLSKYAQPDIAIIANTGTAHIGRLGSVENIAKAKCEITKFLNKNGTLLAHDTELIRKTNDFVGETMYLGLQAKELTDIVLNTNSSEFTYKNQRYKINVEGEHNIQNALFAINAGLLLGMTSEDIAKGLDDYKPIEKRWEISDIKGFRVINDSYNSNPESLKAAVSTFLATQKAPRLLVLGDMGELGKDEVLYHEQIGEFLNAFDDVQLIAVGDLAKSFLTKLTSAQKTTAIHFEDNKKVANFILENISEGTTILFKASRFMKFEEIIKELER